jgi:hypothetical protein
LATALSVFPHIRGEGRKLLRRIFGKNVLPDRRKEHRLTGLFRFWGIAAIRIKRKDTERTVTEMKKRSKLTELLDELRAGEAGNAGEKAEPEDRQTEEGEAEETPAETGAGADEEKQALYELGEAFVARLSLPEGMTKAQAARQIISMWENAGAEGPKKKEAFDEKAADKAPADNGKPAAKESRLPRILRGGLGSMPEADYESMSAEQFRRLKKQLSRAAMDGRRIRL